MIKTNSWIMPGEENFMRPEIKLLKKNVICTNTVDPNQITEACLIKENIVLLQYSESES